MACSSLMRARRTLQVAPYESVAGAGGTGEHTARRAETPMAHYDVAISGAGPAGSTAAAVLARAGARAATSAGAELWERARVTGLGGAARGVAVHTLHNGKQETVQASLLLAADGLRSPIARQLGLMRRCVPHRIALVTHMAGIEELGEYGEMHTSPVGGYCGIAPFGDGRAHVAMVVDEREGRRMSSDPAGYLRAALAAYPNLGRRVRGAELCKPVLATSGLSWLARRYHGRRVALAGDATGYYDPFTGEGVYRAMAGGRPAARRALGGAAGGGQAGGPRGVRRA